MDLLVQYLKEVPLLQIKENNHKYIIKEKV